MTSLAFGGTTGSGAGPSANNCDGKLTGIIRDFDPLTHPDFEPADTHILSPVVHNKQAIPESGIVAGTLSSEFKPVYAKDANSGSQTTFGKMWFDSWFKDSKTYERQEKKSLVGCAVCGDAKVTRALMAPRLGTKGNKKKSGVSTEVATPPPAPSP